MRYIMKGGVWKNSEDEILKAAIMKYGLNQWSRISSLLQRKSAKQCKQRWYQWLDPSIKKTEWTRSEDEKLLQLARVFPSQWRTIAPFVGRTPTQCYERYEKLLDLAQGKTAKESEDLKKLRPGQIDPNPETKPPRLDPIDMDEDEKEMLAEVRVRLANTKGKKAKRKEREKIIEEARRLAKLQKIRELEMAGVENIPTQKEIKRMKQNPTVDYNKEIPFKRDVPEFRYRLEESETPKNLSFAETITIQTLEGKRRDVEEELQRKLDKRRLRKFKERDLKCALLLKSDFERPASFPIQMPDPNIGEKDLEDMKKYNITTPLNSLLASNNRYGMTPENEIMFSARVNISLNHQQPDTPRDDELDGIEGLNYLKKLEREKGQRSELRSVSRAISERMKTPSVNEWEADNNLKLKGLFGQMMKPVNDIEFQIPEEDEEDVEDQQIMDAEEQERIEVERQKENQDEIFKTRSEVLKKNLPRPSSIPALETFSKYHKGKGKNPIASKVNSLIQAQMISLIYSDAIDYPLDQMNFPQKEIPYKEQFSFEELEDARKLVEIEFDKIDKKLSADDYNRAKFSIKFNYEKKTIELAEKDLSEIEIKSYQIENYKQNLEQYKQMVKKSDNHEKKTKKHMAGFEKLIKKKLGQLNTLYDELSMLQNERKVTQNLHMQQKASIQSRISQLQAYYKLVYNSI